MSRLSSAASNLASRPFVAAARDALPWSFTVLLVAFVALLVVVPEPGPFFGKSLGLRISSALLPAFGFMGAALAAALGWFYARCAGISKLAAVAGSLGAYLIALPPFDRPLIPYLQLVGPSGLFVALGIAAIFGFASYALRNAWAGALVVIALALALRLDHISVASIVHQALEPLARMGDTYPALVAIVVVEMLLWAVGLHGPALLAAVVTPVYLTLQMENMRAFHLHQPLPHIVVVSLFLFVFPGGSGATFPLAIMLSFSRIRKLRTLGRVSLVPALFNINEPLLFGAPVVLNPYLIPPFVAAPLLLATTTYVAVAHGLVDRAAFYVPSSVPAFVSTVLATLDPRAIVLVAVNIALAAVVYFPFLRAYERHLERQ